MADPHPFTGVTMVERTAAADALAARALALRRAGRTGPEIATRLKIKLQRVYNLIKRGERREREREKAG